MKATHDKNRYVEEGISFWQQHIQALKSSGLNRKKYCQHHGVNYDRFGYWLKRLNKSTPQKLIPIKVETPTTLLNKPAMKILCALQLQNGHCLQIYDEQALLLVLEKCK